MSGSHFIWAPEGKEKLSDGLACDYELLFDLPRTDPRRQSRKNGADACEKTDGAQALDTDVDMVDIDAPDGRPTNTYSLDAIDHVTKSSSRGAAGGREPRQNHHTVLLLRWDYVLSDEVLPIPVHESTASPTNTVDALRLPRAEVPASAPPPTEGQSSPSCPTDLKQQWLPDASPDSEQFQGQKRSSDTSSNIQGTTRCR